MKMARPRQHQRLRCAVLGAALTSVALAVPWSGAARADAPSEAELAGARALFQDAVALASANNCAAALVKYKRVALVKLSAQVAFNTAECEARLGRLVSALGNYRVAARQAAEDKRGSGVLREVPARIDDLEARIPRLAILRGKGAETAVIELDGSEIGSGRSGNAIPVDPGSHTIVARVGHREYLHETVTLGERETKTFDVAISVAPRVEPPPSDGGPAPAPSPLRVPGIAVTAAGGAVLVAGLAFLGPRQVALDKLHADCNPSGHCPAADQRTGDQGKLFTGLTEVLVPAGVATAVVGVVLLVRSLSSPAAPSDDGDKEGAAEKKDAWRRSLEITEAPGASRGGLGVLGRF